MEPVIYHQYICQKGAFLLTHQALPYMKFAAKLVNLMVVIT